MNKTLSALAAALMLAACQSAPAPNAAAAPPAPVTAPAMAEVAGSKQTCSRRACTMEYEPVCATIAYNGELRRHTFGNRCAVCSDLGRVVRVEAGSCGSLSAH